MHSPKKEPPQTAPSALVFSLGTLPSLRPPSNQRLASRELSPQQLAVHERLKAERVGSAPLAGTPVMDRSSIDYQLGRLKSRRLERDRELFGDSDSKPQSRESMPTSPVSSMFPPTHSVSPGRGRIEDEEGAFPSPAEAAAASAKRPVAVSAATLKRRLALEQKEQAGKELDNATPAKAGGVPGRTGGAGLRGKLTRGPAALPRPTSPPPEQERLKMLEATLQLMQCKGPVAKIVIAQAVAQEDSGPKSKKDAPKDPHSFDWMCQDKAIQDLNSNFLQRWILQDDFQQEAQYQERLKGACKPSEDTASSAMLSAVKTPLRGTRPAAVTQFPPFSVVAAIECNQLFKSFRSKILCRGDEESEAPTAPSPGQASKDTVMTAEKVGRLRKAFPDLTLNSQGEQCYSPCDREIQQLWLSVTPIVRAIAVCMDNGRSTVSKAATEALSAILNCLGCMRLQSLIGTSPDASTRIEALLAQPSSRAIDAQADAIITRLITKGGTASVKFLYDTCGLALLCAIRGMGATNKVLNTVLLTSVAQNPPKTEKSRVLWADSIAFTLLLRWSYLHASHAAKTGNPDNAVAVVNLVAHVLGSMDVARIAAGMSPLGSTQNLSVAIPEGKLPPPLRVIAAAVRDEATTAPPDPSPQPPNTTGRDVKEIATKLSVVADILLADGSPEVRESAKRVLFGYVLLAEEHALIYGYPPMGVEGSAPSPSKAGLDDTQSAASQVIPPTLESVAKRSFMDKKSKLDRILETMRLVRQVYADQFVPAVISRTALPSSPPFGSSRSSSSSMLTSRSSKARSSSSRSVSSRSSRRSSSSAPVTPVRAPKVEITPASTTKSKKRPEDAPPSTPKRSHPSPAKSEGKVTDEKSSKSPNSRSKSPTPAKVTGDGAASAIPHHPHTPSEKKGIQRPGRKVSTPSASPSASRSATSPTPPLPPKSPKKSSSRPTSTNPVIAVGGDVVLTVPSSGKPPKSSPSKSPRSSRSKSPGGDDEDAVVKTPATKTSKHKATLDVQTGDVDDIEPSISGSSKLYVRPTRFADSLPPSVSRSDAELLFRSGVFVGTSHSSRDSSRSGAPVSQQFISIQMATPSYSAWEKAFLVARNAIRAEGILFIPEVHEINKTLLQRAISEEKLAVKEGESELYHHNAATKAQSEETASCAVTVSSSFSVTSLARRWSTGAGNVPKGLSIVPVASEDSQKQSRPEELLTIPDLIRCVACISHIPSSSATMNSSVALNGTVSTSADRQDSREAALEFLRLALLCPGIEVSSNPSKTFASLPASLPYDVSVALLEALLQRCSSEQRGSKAQLTSLFVLHTLLDDIKRAKITVLDGWTAFAPSKGRRKSVAPLTTSLGYSLSKPALDALSSKAIGALTTAISNTRPIGARGKAAPAAGPASVVACECLGIFLSVLNRFVYESAEEARMGLVLGGPSADLKKIQSLSLTTAKTLLNSVSMTASSTRCWSAKSVMIDGMRELTLLFLAAEKRSATGKGASTHNGHLSVISDSTFKESSLLGDSDGTFMLAATPRSARLMPVSPMPTTSPFLSAVDVTRAFDTAVRVCSQALELLAGGSVGEDSEVLQAAVISGWSYMKAAFVCRQDDSESKTSHVSSGSPGPTTVGSSSLLTATYANDLWNSNIAPYLMVAGREEGEKKSQKKSSRRLSLEDYEDDFEDSVKKGGSPPTGPAPVTPLPEKLIKDLVERFERMRSSDVDMSASTSQSKKSKHKSENSTKALDQRICDLIFCA